MKLILIILGCISLTLGVIGIVVPLLPTTPFLLLSAALFVRSSPRLHEWLISNRILGRYIRDYHENRSMPRRAKVSSLIILWLSILYSIFYIVEVMWIKGLLLIIAIAVSWHILSLGTTPRK